MQLPRSCLQNVVTLTFLSTICFTLCLHRRFSCTASACRMCLTLLGGTICCVCTGGDDGRLVWVPHAGKLDDSTDKLAAGERYAGFGFAAFSCGYIDVAECGLLGADCRHEIVTQLANLQPRLKQRRKLPALVWLCGLRKLTTLFIVAHMLLSYKRLHACTSVRSLPRMLLLQMRKTQQYRSCSTKFGQACSYLPMQLSYGTG
jgi:hypothetical protein